jgi:hypothetical protein
MAMELLLARLRFAVTGYFVTAAMRASNSFCYHAASLQ